MLQRDPQIFGSGFRRRKLVPVREHRVLHPVQIARVVHVAHEVDISRQNADAVKMGESESHVTFNIGRLKRVYSLIATET